MNRRDFTHNHTHIILNHRWIWILIACFTILAGCAENDAWRYDAIGSQESSFNSSRLVYSDQGSHLHLEFLRMGEEIEAFLFLDQYLFAPSSDNPKFTEISFKVEDLEWMELSPLREGRMRLKLSKKCTERLIYALQEGREVAILAGGFQETVLSGTFKDHYNRFFRGSYELLNSFKGPIE